MSDCVNLAKRFGQQYKVAFDECYDPRGVPKSKLDPWMMELPCSKGTIHPFDGSRLAVEVDGRPITARRLAATGICAIHQDGDVEKTFIFAVDDFDVVAAIVSPRRRRRLTEAQRQQAVERLVAHRFSAQPEPQPRSAAGSANPRQAETRPSTRPGKRKAG